MRTPPVRPGSDDELLPKWSDGNPHLDAILPRGPLLRPEGSRFLEGTAAANAWNPPAPPPPPPPVRQQLRNTPLEHVLVPWRGSWEQPCIFHMPKGHKKSRSQ